jgi:Na+/proline symporter
MNGFLTSTFTRQKFQGLLINTVLGNFAGYVAGSLVTFLFTYRSVERRAIWNLFGVLPRKKIVVHLLPQWLEWLLALIVGFLIMELVRYSLNHRKYSALLSAMRQERQPEAAVNTRRQSVVDDGGAAQEAPLKSVQMNPLEPI